MSKKKLPSTPRPAPAPSYQDEEGDSYWWMPILVAVLLIGFAAAVAGSCVAMLP